jgi:hypothetical protein
MFKKLGKMVKRNVKSVGEVVKGNMNSVKSLSKGDVKGALKNTANTVKTAVRTAKDTRSDVAGSAVAGKMLRGRGKSSGVATPSGGMMGGRGFARAIQSKDMPMGQLDRMRAQRGMVGSIPGQMRDYSKNEEE